MAVVDEKVQSSVTTMSADKQLQKAKAHLSVNHPYFGMLTSRLKHEKKEDICYYASNGIRFLYNEEFILTCSLEELEFILTNCVMHHIFSHQQRRLSRKGYLWQLATDFAINNILYESGLAIPQGANFNIEYKKMYAEEIYTLLKEEYLGGADAFDEQNFENEEQEAFNNLQNIDAELSPEDESNWQYAASIAGEVAKKKSAMPSGFERVGKKIQTNNVDWRFELYNAINRHMRNNYAFMPPNKKHIWRGVALPSLASDTLSLCVAIDSSGSIDEALLGTFMSEFKNIMRSFPAIKIELIIADARVHAHYTFSGGEKLDFPIKGGGGTDYRPTFEYIEANLPMTTMLLYFTDGDGWFPKITPHYEVLWALSRKAKTPFGRPLQILNN